LKPIDDGCAIKFVPVFDGNEHKRVLVRQAIPDTDGIYQPTIHYDCGHNQLQAIRNRVIGVVNKPTPQGLAMVRGAARVIAATLPISAPDDIYALANRHGGLKGSRYRAAADELCVGGLHPGDSTVKMFVKAERFDGHTKVNPDPRAIQFRGPKYCVEIAQYLRPVEEHLYQFDHASAGVPRSRNVAKGLNSVDRAELLVEKARHFRCPVFVTCDASRFDMHVSEALLKIEHSVYLAGMPVERFRELLAMQLKNRCYSSIGIKYVVRGRRMSGDMNTAIGNVVLMLAMMMAFCKLLGLKRWDCLDDGDDIVVILEEGDVCRFQKEIIPVFAGFGMEMKVDAAVRSIHEVEFCQSRIVEFSAGRYKFVRDYRAVMSKATSGVRNWLNPAYRSRTIHAIGTCELVLGLGVPVLQSYALALLRNSRGASDLLHHAPDGLRARTLRDVKLLGLRNLGDLKPQPIQQCARESFAQAFGLDEMEQIRMEKALDSWIFTMDVTQHGPEWDVASWTCAQSHNELYRL